MFKMGSRTYTIGCHDRYGIGAALQRARELGTLPKAGCAAWCHNLMKIYEHWGFPEWQTCYDSCRWVKQREIYP